MGEPRRIGVPLIFLLLGLLQERLPVLVASLADGVGHQYLLGL